MNQLRVRAALPDELAMLGYGHLSSKPNFRPQMCRVGLVDGQIVCHIVAEHHILNYGTVELRTAGIGRAYTVPALREQGFGTAVVRDALTYIVEDQAHIALLYDPSGFFSRFGFHPVWPSYELTFFSEQAAALASPLRVRTAHLGDSVQISRLYEGQWRGRVTYLRDHEMWAWRLADPGLGEIVVAVGDDDVAQGYIYGHDLASRQVEIVCSTSDSVITLMCAIGHLHLLSHIDQIRWPVMPDDLLAIYAPQVIDCSLSATYHQRSGWMARVVDLPRLIRAVLPELDAQSGFAADSLRIRPHSDGVQVTTTQPKVTGCRIDHATFVQLLFGSYNPTAAGERFGWSDETTNMITALFPARVASLGYWDWF